MSYSSALEQLARAKMAKANAKTPWAKQNAARQVEMAKAKVTMERAKEAASRERERARKKMK